MSATRFRGRRVLDPVPVQRGSLPQETRYRTSKFSDLEAAWENVGEVKSVLQAAEDRIYEAQVGTSQGLQTSHPCEPLQEIFSERQRYGRVARYDLRPDWTKNLPQSRSSKRQQGYGKEQVRQTSPTSYTQPLPRMSSTTVPLLTELHLDSGHSYSKVPYNSRVDTGPEVTSAVNFEDSLEIQTRPAAAQRLDMRSTSPLGGKPLIKSNSDVLTRLKERIKLQKQQASLTSRGAPDADPCVNGLSARPVSVTRSVPLSDSHTRPASTKPGIVAVNRSEDDLHTQPPPAQLGITEDTALPPEVVLYTRPALAKRKVASAPAAPAYKGFNEVEERPVRDQEKGKGTGKDSRAYQRSTYKPYSKEKTSSKDMSRPLKPAQRVVLNEMPPRGIRKVQRITAPTRPKDIISTSSWRTGQQTVKKVLGPSPKKKSPKRPQSKASQSSGVSTVSKPYSMEWKEEEENRGKVNDDKASQNKSRSIGGEDNRDSGDETDHLQDELSEHTLSPVESEPDHNNLEEAKKLRDSKVLSTEARNVLSDLDLSSEHSGLEEEKPKDISKPKQHQNVSGKKRKAPAAQSKSEPVYPKEKLRHYDTEQVKKYMAKQVADRKRKIKEEKVMKQKAIEERKRKLEELYNKQKKTLKANLATREKKRMGETFSKGRGDPRSFFLPFHHPFEADEIIEYCEDTEVSESDKENLDIASYKGLPNQGGNPNRRGSFDEYRYPLGTPTESEASEPMSNELKSRHTDDDDDDMGHDHDNADAEVKTVVVSTRPLKGIQDAEHGIANTAVAPCHTRQSTGIHSEDPTSAQPIQFTQHRATSPVSPNREDRISAIRHTATALKERLEAEARRLGLNLEAKALGEATRTARLPVNGQGIRPEFGGNLPGVDNIHEQADLNKELSALDTAATKIQAAYRGHSVRQGLNWKLPSGQTLGAALRDAPHVAHPGSDAMSETGGTYHTPRDDTASVLDTESLSMAASATGPGSRFELSAASNSDSRHRFGNLLQHSTIPAHDPVTGVVQPQFPPISGNIRLPPSREPWSRSTGDSLSVINIFTRQNPYLKLIEDDITKDAGSETASLLDTGHSEKDQDTVISGSGDELERNLDRTLTRDGGDEYEDDFTEPSHDTSKGRTSPQRTPSPDKKTPHDDASYSQSYASPSPSKKSGPSAQELSSEHDLSNQASSYLDSSNLSNRDPVMTSTLRPASVETKAPYFDLPRVHGNRVPPPVYFPASQGGDRLSPVSLDHRMMAELHRLENMEESVRQLTDVERTRAVALAQQETVSLAQILKARQQNHAREMESLRLRAKQEAFESARQLEEARHAAAVAAAEATQTVAKVRTEAASVISHSADRLVLVQNEAARVTVEAAKQVEEARLSVAKTQLEAANQQSVDVRSVAASAASAAASAAVKSAMGQYQRSRGRDGGSTRSYRESPSYTYSYTDSERTLSYSRSRSRSPHSEVKRTESISVVKSESGGGYASEEFESYADSRQDRTLSVPTASGMSVKEVSTPAVPSSDHVTSVAVKTARPGNLQSRRISQRGKDQTMSEKTESVPEDVDQSVAESIDTDIGADFALDEDSVAEIISQDSRRKESKEARPTSLDVTQYSTNFEDSMVSPHTATDDELDYRSVLPSESHRRRSLENIKRRGSLGSDAGTFSYSSDEIADVTLVDTFPERAEDGVAGPFSGEDSFSKFTSEMVRQMKEEEVRAKHQAALLSLREKALKEKTKAEMDWLDLQKRTLRDKGADDVMPSLRKRQRGILLKLQAEQAEIKRLKTANRAARYERRLLLLQQEEIARLHISTKKMRHRVGEDSVTERPKEESKSSRKKKAESERYLSSTQSDGIPEEIADRPLEENTADRSCRSRSGRSPPSDVIRTISKSSSVPEDISDAQSPIATQPDTSFPTYDASERSSRRKRSFSDGESDEGSISSEKHSVTKASPTSSDRTISKQLKKLKQLESDERFLTQREIQLKNRRKEAEKLLENQKKMVEWKKRLDEEDKQVRNLLNQALNLNNATSPTQPQTGQSLTPGEEEEREKSLSTSKSLVLRESPLKQPESGGSTRSSDRSGSSTAVSIKRSRTGLGRSNSESSVPEEVPSGGGWESEVTTEPSSRVKSRDSSMPEEIAGEYTNDTFESVDSTLSPAHSTPLRQDVSSRKEVTLDLSRRSSKDEGNKSEEELSMTETSDHSDIEVRVRALKSQLEQRKREAKRLYHEHKRQRKALLRAQEDSLRKELQEVEMVINRTKQELEKEPMQNRIPDIKPSIAPTGREMLKQSKAEAVILVPDSPSTVEHESSPDVSVNEISELSQKSVPSEKVLDQRNSQGVPSAISRVPSKEGQRSGASAEVVPTVEIDDHSSSRFEKTDKSSEVKDLDISDRSRSSSPTESTATNESNEIEEDVLPADDVSPSEDSEIKTRSSLSDRSGRSSDVKSKFSDVSTESKSRPSPLDIVSPDKVLSREESPEKSPLSARGYSMSFESSVNDDATTSDDVSERLSVEDDSSLPEELPDEQQKPSEKSEIEEALSIKESNASGRSPQIEAPQKDKLEIPPGKSLDTSPSYSADFEVSSVQENFSIKSVKSSPEDKESVEAVSPAYTSEFEKEASAKGAPSSLYTPDFEGSVSSRDRLTRDGFTAGDLVSSSNKKSSVRDEVIPLQPKDTLLADSLDKPETLSDDDTITEDVPEDLPEESEAESTPRGAGTELVQDMEKEVAEPFRGTVVLDVPPQIIPEKLEEREKDEQPVEQLNTKLSLKNSADRITDEIAELLMTDAVNCMAGVYRSRQDVAQRPESSKGAVEQNVQSENTAKIPVTKPPRVEIPAKVRKVEDPPGVRSLETPSYLKGDISEEEEIADLSFDKDDSISGLDFKTDRVDGERPIGRIPGDHSRPWQRIQEKSPDSIVAKLSDDLMKEAVSQMIDIMKKRKAKLALETKEGRGERTEKDKYKDKNNDKEKRIPEAFEGRVSPPRLGDVSPRSDTSISPHPETSPRYMEKYMVHIPHHKGDHHRREARSRSPDRSRSPESHREPLSPPGSPGSKREHKSLDGDELHRRLATLQLNEQLGELLGDGDEEFGVNESKMLELPDDEDKVFSRPRGPSILFDVPHSVNEVPSLVSNYLSVYYNKKKTGQSLSCITPPPELVSSADSEDLETISKRVYRKLVFELTGDVFRDLLAEEAQSHPPPWMKPKRRRKPRFHHGMRRLQEVDDYLPVVQQCVMHLVGLGDARPTLESVRRKTPLKTGKKDAVDAILIQELREEEPQWIDYDDDELAVKFQVADAILESLMTETVMVMNAIQDRRDARNEGQPPSS